MQYLHSSYLKSTTQFCKAFKSTQRLGQICNLDVKATSSKTVGFMLIQSRHSFTIEKKNNIIPICFVSLIKNINSNDILTRRQRKVLNDRVLYRVDR